ncbi:hypothetical protein RI129_001700 [Pyrocoelia pectoralis]|uniref:CCHC-type domain-containing protein n=1 Tax=Pyrocoelia pectoralis TaxID=417401 RepID=A0AAN7VVF2_9COLE
MLEYLFTMKEIAAKGTVEQEAVIQYTVDGITDDFTNKLSLYEAKTYTELKNKLEIYERVRMKQEVRGQIYKGETNSTNYGKKKPYQPKCYNCGEKEHIVMNCTKPKVEPQCYSAETQDISLMNVKN